MVSKFWLPLGIHPMDAPDFDPPAYTIPPNSSVGRGRARAPFGKILVKIEPPSAQIMVEIGPNTIEIGFLEGQIVKKSEKFPRLRRAPRSPLGNYLKNIYFSSNSGHFHPISSSVGRREGRFFS